MIKSITNFLIIFFIFQQLKSQISQIDQNGYNAFCDETLHLLPVNNILEIGRHEMALLHISWVHTVLLNLKIR